MTMSACGANTVEELSADLIARFHALWQAILAPHDGGPVSRITIKGADTTVGTEVLPTIPWSCMN